MLLSKDRHTIRPYTITIYIIFELFRTCAQKFNNAVGSEAFKKHKIQASYENSFTWLLASVSEFLKLLGNGHCCEYTRGISVKVKSLASKKVTKQ